MRHAVVSLITVSLLGPFALLSGQQPPSVDIGVPVRVTANELEISQHTGRLTAVDSNSLHVGDLQIPWSSVTSLEISHGLKTRKMMGGTLGMLAGMAVGNSLASRECDRLNAESQGFLDNLDACLLNSFVGIFGGGLVGGFIGRLIGASTASWQEVPLDRVRVNLAPQRDGVALGLSVSF